MSDMEANKAVVLAVYPDACVCHWEEEGWWGITETSKLAYLIDGEGSPYDSEAEAWAGAAAVLKLERTRNSQSGQSKEMR